MKWPGSVKSLPVGLKAYAVFDELETAYEYIEQMKDVMPDKKLCVRNPHGTMTRHTWVVVCRDEESAAKAHSELPNLTPKDHYQVVALRPPVHRTELDEPRVELTEGTKSVVLEIRKLLLDKDGGAAAESEGESPIEEDADV